MKRLFVMSICSLALLGVAIPVKAQTIGFKLGMTSSKFALDPDEEQDRLSQFAGGGFVRFGVGALALQAEVLALTKGAKSTLDTGDEVFDGKLKLDYIEVPITALFNIGNVLYAFGGPTVSFETSCTVEAEVSGTEFSADCDDPDSGDNFQRKNVDFGATAGLGVQFAAGPGAVFVEGRHTWGLTNLNDDPADEQKVHNRAFAFFAGYAIPIGR